MSKRQSIRIEGLEHGDLPIPNAARVGRLIMSGSITGKDPRTGKTPTDLDSEFRTMFENARSMLEAAGGTFDEVVKMTFVVGDRSATRPALNRVWVEHFPREDDRPARHVVEDGDIGRSQCELVAFLDDANIHQ